MKIFTSAIVLAAALLISSPAANAQTYEWATYGFESGDTAFSANLGGVSFNAAYSGSPYLYPTFTPSHYSPQMIKVDGSGPESLISNSFAIGSTAEVNTWTLTLNGFSEALGNDTVLLLGNLAAFDNISDHFSIQATLLGVPVSTAGWTLIGNYDDNPNPSDGISNVWNGTTGYLSPEYALSTGAGPGSNTYLALLQPDNEFDSLVITMHSNMVTPYDETVVGLGRIAPVPEPSAALLFGIAGAMAFARRGRAA